MANSEKKLLLIDQKLPNTRFYDASCTRTTRKWWEKGSDAGDFFKYLIIRLCVRTSLRHGEEEKDRGNGGNGRPRSKRGERNQNFEELPVL